MSIFGATDTPVRTSGNVSSGFQSQSGQPYLHLVEVYMIYVPWDSPLVWHLLPVYMASIAAGHFPHMCASAEIGCHIWTTDTPLGDPAILWLLIFKIVACHNEM